MVKVGGMDSVQAWNLELDPANAGSTKYCFRHDGGTEPFQTWYLERNILNLGQKNINVSTDIL